MIPEDIALCIKSLANERFSPKVFVPGETSVPASGKVFDEHELLLGVEAVLDGWWTDGRFTKEFERRFCALMNRKSCSIVNSGSSANLVAFAALTSRKLGDRRLCPGDEVITVAAGFPTTIAPIIQHGCIPVFVDIDSETYNTRLDLIEVALSSKTRAVMIAHTMGNAFPVKEIADWCRERKLWLIEDTCDAIGGTYDGQPLGSFGDLATCSFYPAHHLTMGEGGAVLSNDALLTKIVRSFRDWGRDCWCGTGCDNTCGIRYGWKFGDLPKGYDHKYVYSEIGYNLKATDIQAAIGLAQLDKLESFHEARRKNHAFLLERLQCVSDVLRLPSATEGSDPSWFGFLMSVRSDAGFSREDLMRYLNDRKIGTRLLFAGNFLKQPCFAGVNIPHRVAGSLDYTDDAMCNAFWIGCYPGLDEVRLRYSSDAIIEFCRNKRV